MSSPSISRTFSSSQTETLYRLKQLSTHPKPPSPGKYHSISCPKNWNGLPFPSPGDLPDPAIEPRSPMLQAESLLSEPPGKPIDTHEIIAKDEFTCPTHSEAKQMQMSEVGAEKVLLQDQETRRWLMLKKRKVSDAFQGEVFVGKIWGEGCRWYDFLLIGWWWGNRKVLQGSWLQPEAAILHLDGGPNSPRRTQRYRYVYSLRRNRASALISALWFLDCSFCVFAFPYFPE